MNRPQLVEIDETDSFDMFEEENAQEYSTAQIRHLSVTQPDLDIPDFDDASPDLLTLVDAL